MRAAASRTMRRLFSSWGDTLRILVSVAGVGPTVSPLPLAEDMGAHEGGSRSLRSLGRRDDRSPALPPRASQQALADLKRWPTSSASGVARSLIGSAWS